jgi:hypothetical protein
VRITAALLAALAVAAVCAASARADVAVGVADDQGKCA